MNNSYNFTVRVLTKPQRHSEPKFTDDSNCNSTGTTGRFERQSTTVYLNIFWMKYIDKKMQFLVIK